jgi:hypothetical protein
VGFTVELRKQQIGDETMPTDRPIVGGDDCIAEQCGALGVGTVTKAEQYGCLLAELVLPDGKRRDPYPPTY